MGSWTTFEPQPSFSMHLAATQRGLCRLSLGTSTERFVADLAGLGATKWELVDDPILREAKRQLSEYFQGKLKRFRLPLDLRGTPFQRKVWRALLDIPYGETRSYAQIAAAIGSPKAVRAVGAANGANPVAIIVPCHRVIASSGGLGGYSAGLDCKRKLLALESGVL
jgi:methylated-DNA-[protein]-cysteine S-methyltransferase